MAPRTNWTELDDMVQGGSLNTETQYRGDAFETTASATWDGANRGHIGIAAELKAVSALSAPAVGRMHVRGIASGIKRGIAAAKGWMHVWGTAQGESVFTGATAPAVGRMHFRGTATGIKIVSAPPASGRMHFRGTAIGGLPPEPVSQPELVIVAHGSMGYGVNKKTPSYLREGKRGRIRSGHGNLGGQ
jgi:hypothetical protein